MPGEDGVSLIRRAKAANPNLACMLLTAYGTVDLAVAAMKDGADDFLTKPITDLDQLELRVDKAIKTRALERQVDELKSQLDVKLETFTGNSPQMQKVYRLIRQAAPSNANVLIEGPSGTGKELVAHALHSLSPRAEGPFVAVECAALSPTLLESELFGHEKGAFTDAVRQKIGRFEAANGGTLFLDEISEIDASTQVKLLRVLETRTFQRVGGTEDIKTDIRIVAATNRDLAKYVAEGKFREDLYYRLNVIDIHLPALKERSGDIALLVSRFLKEFAAENGGRVTGIDARAMKALEDYSWPGNVRQLRNIVEKMTVLSGGGRLTIDDVPVEILEGSAPKAVAEPEQPATGEPEAAPAAYDIPATQSLADSEKAKILSVLDSVNGNKSKAADILGISRRTIHRKLKEWKIET
jgi:DNA-binding NtrC family response regulator